MTSQTAQGNLVIVLSCVCWLLGVLGVGEEKAVGWLSGEVVGWAARTIPLTGRDFGPTSALQFVNLLVKEQICIRCFTRRSRRSGIL